MQVLNGKEVEVPIAFSSRICRGKEKTLGSAEGELLAAVFALTKYKQYVGATPFDLITDSRALCALKSASNLAGKLARWSFFLEEFQINLVHKAGSTLQNADGLSRCATAGDSEADKNIQLESLEALEENYWDDMEAMQLERPRSKIAKETIEVNMLQQFTRAYPCSICSHVVGTAKHKQCGACGETVHSACLASKPSVGYWFCSDCAPSLVHGHSDPALNLALHNVIRGSTSYPGASEEEVSRMKEKYSFVRGCLIQKDEEGEKIVPPPCLRADIVSKMHEELVHMGWERTYHALKQTYHWPGMREEVKQLCQACLSCQLSSGVFRRKPTITNHLRASKPREAWSIDLAPGLKMADGSRSNIVVCVDDFSKFVLLDILTTRQAEDLKNWVLKRVFGPYGRPLQVRSDRGNEF